MHRVRRLAAAAAPERGRLVDDILLVSGLLLGLRSVVRDRTVLVRLGGVRVPNNIFLVGMVSARVGQGLRASHTVEETAWASDLGKLVGTQIRQSNDRSKELLDLQASVERLTHRLVWLTLVLGVIGVAGIAATIWSAVR